MGANLSDNAKCREKRLQRFQVNPTSSETSPSSHVVDRRTEYILDAAKSDSVLYARSLLCDVSTGYYPDLALILAQKAAASGSLNCLKLALQRGVNVDSFDSKEGWRLIHLAAGYGHVECVALLLKHGAKINETTGDWNFTALHLAAAKGHAACVRLLLQQGADTAAADKDGDTALSEAAANGHVECVHELLLGGAAVNSVGWRARTPLHAAARGGHINCLRVLLMYRADSKLLDNDNRTAFDLVPSDLRRTVVAFLPSEFRRTACELLPCELMVDGRSTGF